ncbi:MAG: malto-oligosyltrehalose trehalohydrolase [Chloroflexi bacterium]|nr:malto-oligosyltrehalose trehalohydrolase [Chloroflexota bacterium]
MSAPWSLDLGANVEDGGVRFRVWAPNARRVEVEIGQGERASRQALTAEDDGYHAGLVAGAQAGDRYRYRLDGGDPFPDPCSRSQPDGPHGPSQVVDPRRFQWHDEGWTGIGPDGLVIYELHVGTFTPAGTFDAAIGRLADLRDLGITAIELMPLAEFPGRRNWGYDGVDLYAPFSGYGGPEGLRRFVDAAHGHGLAVLLDAVYNHFGPDGNYLRVYADAYFTHRHTTPWGDAINYDGPSSGPVRHFVLQNVRYWLREYHLDGLRLDATHAIVDDSPRHLLSEIAEAAHSIPGRRAVVIAEDHRNVVQQIHAPERGGLGLDGVWADDFHHALRTYLTGEREAYYANYTGSLADLATTIEGGFLFQGQKRPATGELRGTKVTDEPARAFVYCSENHDQVGNRALGERLAHLIDRERYLVASAVLLLVPETVMLFQGQEFAASSPFQFFTDHNADLGKLVTDGRRKEFAAFTAFADPKRRKQIPDPQAESTFTRSVLDWSERVAHAGVLDLYRTLLRLRRDDPVLRRQDRSATRAAALTTDLLAIRRFQDDDERLLLANFGADAVVVDAIAMENLGLFNPEGWRLLWSTPSTTSADEAVLTIPGRSARILAR